MDFTRIYLFQFKSEINGKQKIAIVTGAGSEMERAMFLALRQHDWYVVLAGRQEKNLKEIAILGIRGKSLQFITYVTDAENVIHLFKETVNRLGRIDLLFNNTGIVAPSKSFDRLSLEDWQQVIATNLTGAFLCAREAFRAMKIQQPGGGPIINNGSVSAHVPRPNSAPYTASKHGITGLTRSVAPDGREFNICCGQKDIDNAATVTPDITPQASGLAGLPFVS